MVENMVPVASSASSALSFFKIINNLCCTSIHVHIDNIHPTFDLKKRGEYSKNEIVEPLQITIPHNECKSMKWKSRFKSISVSGMIIYEILGQRTQDDPLLLVVGWKIPRWGHNKYFVHVGHQTEHGLMNLLYAEERPDNKRGLKILLEAAYTKSVSRRFDQLTIETSMTDGKDAILQIKLDANNTVSHNDNLGVRNIISDNDNLIYNLILSQSCGIYFMINVFFSFFQIFKSYF
ncbi:hypothetical protein C1645_759528 [Glomus cerebriforme]|uniref:Uncharacterized protein n=1 Tax=Glomus cerebriforme TaxID=658196 RepID=A0A397T8S3_9GLOM|nr:hypothetical protein C1645_759528 [Glomus cerebriforme]